MQDKGDQLVLGWLRLRERLGEGAMGQVFKAWNVKTQRMVAVKTLHKELVANARAMDRFRQEIEAAAQLDHRNIVKARDADEIDSRPFMVMDFIDGVNLSHLVKTQGPLPIPVAVECVRQASLGLQHAFERGVVHRDIKPANLLVAGAAQWADGKARWPAVSAVEVKLLDFGLARLDIEHRYSTRLTQPGSTLGTVDYMAPEQAESARDADQRADIYGLGCTLFYLLAGRPPFPGTSIAEKIGARMAQPPPSVRQARPEVPQGLDEVVRRMMARQPADRYQTPAEAAVALAPYTAVVVDVPRMEIEERVPLALPTSAPAVAGPPPLARPVVPLPVAQHVEAMESAPVDGAIADPGSNPFAATLFEPAAAAAAANGVGKTAAARTAPPTATAGLNPRVIIPIVGGAALLFVLFIACSGYLLMKWLGGAKPVVDAYPPGAALQITEAFLSSDVMRPGERKSVIVKLQRKGFHGPVELRLEGLPPGVRADATTVAAGAAARKCAWSPRSEWSRPTRWCASSRARRTSRPRRSCVCRWCPTGESWARASDPVAGPIALLARRWKRAMPPVLEVVEPSPPPSA